MPYPQGLPIHTIWDEIADILESTHDLLSLALTCRIFKELIIPDHLEYRHICCDIRRLDIWNFLASRPRLARGIRSVKLIHEPNKRICLPQAFNLKLTNISDRTTDLHHTSLSSSQPTIENLALFRNALSEMTSLKRFTWKHGRTSPEELTKISHVLTNTTHCLEALTVDFAWVWLYLRDGVPFETLSVGSHYSHYESVLIFFEIWSLTNLKKVSIYRPGPEPIHMILHLCPDIEDLEFTLHLTTATASYIMQHAHWKKLRRLRIFSRTPHDTPDTEPTISIFTSFLNRHINLESLYLDLSEDPVPNSPVSSLLKLRSIGSGIHRGGLVLPPFLSADTISRLVHWECPIGNINIDNFPQMDNLQSACLAFHEAFLPEVHAPFLSKATNLKRICLLSTSVGHHKHQELVESFLEHSNSLTHLFCNYSLDGIILLADLHARLDSSFKTLSSLGSLTYFRIFEDSIHTPLLLKLQRDEDGLYSMYHPVGLKEAGGDPDFWGNFFSDL